MGASQPAAERQDGDGELRQRRLRADARRNEATLLDTARDVFVERGPDAPLDEIARRAGVGIGTLYRRFADRGALMAAVVQSALAQTAQAAERAAAEHPDPMDALAAYLHAVIDLKTPAVISILLEQLDLDSAAMAAVRERSAAGMQSLVDQAHASGGLRPDVTFGDIGMMLVRIARPLPGAFAPQQQSELAHRHVELLLNALSTDRRSRLPGRGWQRSDFARLRSPSS